MLLACHHGATMHNRFVFLALCTTQVKKEKSLPPYYLDQYFKPYFYCMSAGYCRRVLTKQLSGWIQCAWGQQVIGYCGLPKFCCKGNLWKVLNPESKPIRAMWKALHVSNKCIYICTYMPPIVDCFYKPNYPTVCHRRPHRPLPCTTVNFFYL